MDYYKKYSKYKQKYFSLKGGYKCNKELFPYDLDNNKKFDIKNIKNVQSYDVIQLGSQIKLTDNQNILHNFIVIHNYSGGLNEQVYALKNDVDEYLVLKRDDKGDVQNEIKILEKIKNDNICNEFYIDYYIHENDLFLEYMDGTLDKITLSLLQKIIVFVNLICIYDCLYRNFNLLYDDIKLNNIGFSLSGNGQIKICIIDFGGLSNSNFIERESNKKYFKKMGGILLSLFLNEWGWILIFRGLGSDMREMDFKTHVINFIKISHNNKQTIKKYNYKVSDYKHMNFLLKWLYKLLFFYWKNSYDEILNEIYKDYHDIIPNVTKLTRDDILLSLRPRKLTKLENNNTLDQYIKGELKINEEENLFSQKEINDEIQINKIIVSSSNKLYNAIKNNDKNSIITYLPSSDLFHGDYHDKIPALLYLIKYWEGNIDQEKYLFDLFVENGADILCGDFYGYTPLLYSIRYNKLHILDIIINKYNIGINQINTIDSFWDLVIKKVILTPLTYAKEVQNNIEMIKYIEENGGVEIK